MRKTSIKKLVIEGACEERDIVKEELRLKRREYDRLVTECENEIYGSFVNTYFQSIGSSKGLTHRELLEGLRKLYIHNKTANHNFILRFKDFIDMFPRDRAIQNSNYKKQHVFEAMCRLLLLFNYDNGELGIQKGFYGPLGNIENEQKRTTEQILDEAINEGNKAGLVDILFQIEKMGEKTNADDRWACEYPLTNAEGIQPQEKEYVLIQNKYYDKEKSNLNNYDVARIYALAEHKNKLARENLHNTYNFKIVLMVNNQEALSENLERVREKYNIIYKIYGTAQIDEWFQQMLFEIISSKNITLEEFVVNKGHLPNVKPLLQPRFHQEFFTNTTLTYYNKGYKKFIWGAVPRSGKSFMIGNTVSKLKHVVNNDILIILGAKTETQTQFVDDLFQKYENFTGYNIVVSDELREKYNYGLAYARNNGETNNNIFLVSQQWFKNKKIYGDEQYINGRQKIKNTETSQFHPPVLQMIKKVLKTNKIHLFFDEIHKGGSTDNSESILYALKNAGYTIDIFIMVTATFAKPNIRYKDNFIDSNEVQIIEWSYEDQQNMKEVNDETKKQMFLNSRITENNKNNIQWKELQKLFDKYQDRYGSEYLAILSNEYKKHPELVLIEPETIIQNNQESIVNISDVRATMIKNLKCDACVPNNELNYYIDPRNIFDKIEPLHNLLEYISRRDKQHSIYNYFDNVLHYPIGASHTELWFLPDKDLYLNPQDCVKCKNINIEENMDEDLVLQRGINTGKTIEKSLANIEPLTRGLALLMKNTTGFERYNIFIVHGTDLSYLSKKNSLKIGLRDYLASIGIKLYDKTNGESLRNQIKRFEIETYRRGKSLIILTGGSLRLGISLPCVDIAFNFDDIQSLDNNYQTMFRVLTERHGKKYGYYIDFNKDRAKTFLYEYNNIYGSGKLKNTVKDKVESLQALLFTFNYNGLNLSKQDSLQEVNLYEDLIQNLQLTETKYVDYWSKLDNIQKVIKKSLAFSGNMELLMKLNGYFDKIDEVFKRQKATQTVREGRNIITSHIIEPTPLDATEDDENNNGEPPREDDYLEIMNKMAIELPSIVMLFGLFSDENNIHCNTLEECITKSIIQLRNNPNFCSCKTLNDPETNIFDCYQNSPENIRGKVTYSKEKLALYLQVIYELLYSKKSTYRQQTELLRTNLEFIFDNIRRLIMKNKQNALIYEMDSEEIKEKIEQYLPVRKQEKDKFGEVFTPEKLINEMLDILPPSVWSNPNLKWLDPANGIGNFPMIVYKKLMDGLKTTMKDKTQRSKHILTNMLYMVEINPKNVKISEKIFGKDANICCADFLNDSEKCFKKFGINKFDIIVGNPPFQEEGQSGGKNKLFERVTSKCLQDLNVNGYLLFVTPDNIFTGNTSKVYTEMLNNNVEYISFNNIQKEYFPKIGQSMCYFLVKKTEPLGAIGPMNSSHKTVVENTSGKISVTLQNREINPITDWTMENEKIIDDYLISQRNNAVYYRGTTADNYRGKKYTVIYTPDQNLKTDDINLAPGIGIKKLVLFESKPLSDGILDVTGEYGVGPHTFYIPFNTASDGKKLQTFFKSDLYKKLVKLTLTSQYLKTALIGHLNINKIIDKPSAPVMDNVIKKTETRKQGKGGSKKRKTRRHIRRRKY